MFGVGEGSFSSLCFTWKWGGGGGGGRGGSPLDPLEACSVLFQFKQVLVSRIGAISCIFFLLFHVVTLKR